ncbi:hypothetical protein GCK72_024756 [Caenorhabditis remanei]|uniref:Uncharacterized protein n=1 Tax=Caenorhabditis remanei TaxID=31234 RepID=A0A6A5G173_CAERE|nr:hypothetical protein GCK72_024756 [Caenorhabditis remanei]KAF1748289.1 hypothetical protein GCK72_024756 [Caenorhabditis remanei]
MNEDPPPAGDPNSRKRKAAEEKQQQEEKKARDGVPDAQQETTEKEKQPQEQKETKEQNEKADFSFAGQAETANQEPVAMKETNKDERTSVDLKKKENAEEEQIWLPSPVGSDGMEQVAATMADKKKKLDQVAPSTEQQSLSKFQMAVQKSLAKNDFIQMAIDVLHKAPRKERSEFRKVLELRRDLSMHSLTEIQKIDIQIVLDRLQETELEEPNVGEAGQEKKLKELATISKNN